MQILHVAQSLHQGEITMALGSRDSISIKQQQMGDVSHQQTCIMCFLAIICFDLQSWGVVLIGVSQLAKMQNSKIYAMNLLNEGFWEPSLAATSQLTDVPNVNKLNMTKQLQSAIYLVTLLLEHIALSLHMVTMTKFTYKNFSVYMYSRTGVSFVFDNKAICALNLKGRLSCVRTNKLMCLMLYKR
jgi:hypothetical protein